MLEDGIGQDACRQSVPWLRYRVRKFIMTAPRPTVQISFRSNFYVLFYGLLTFEDSQIIC